jgi:hypothetical protein
VVVQGSCRRLRRALTGAVWSRCGALMSVRLACFFSVSRVH